MDCPEVVALHVRLAVIGFGNVGRNFAGLLKEKADELASRYDLTCAITGVATRSRGGFIAAEGGALDLSETGLPAAGMPPGAAQHVPDTLAFVRACPADVVIEISTLSPLDGQPATDYIRAALEGGRHVITANKGPIANAYHDLRALARARNLALRFESTVMDGTPIINLAEFCLPASRIAGFRGIVNGTTNVVLTAMEEGRTLEEGIAEAQRLGIAEADPSADLDGWDASAKASVLATVLMDAPVTPAQVERLEVGAEAMRRLMAALPSGYVLRQVAEGRRDGEQVRCTVRLETLPVTHLFAQIRGTKSILALQTDTMNEVTIIEDESGPRQTAFGLLSDLVAIARQYR
jgi:homoserine dehydrogenase